MPSARAIARSSVSFGSRRPFSIIDSWLGARSTAVGELFERHAALGAQLPDAAADREGIHLFIVEGVLRPRMLAA